jgi:hypothetical protein
MAGIAYPPRPSATPSPGHRMTKPFLRHVERHLGRIQEGWLHDRAGDALSYSVARFDDAPVAGASSFLSLGLSKAPLRLGDGARSLRQELLLASSNGRDMTAFLVDALQHVATAALQAGCAYSARSVVRLPWSPPGASSIAGFYVAAPVCYPDALHLFEEAGRDPILIAWLVPITRAEGVLVLDSGWEALENRLVDEDPDLLDWCRASIV